MTTKELLNYCNEFLSYDSLHGLITWKKKKKGVTNGGRAGTVANNGYRVITLKGKKHLAHRLVFLMTWGHMPKYIDHINGNKLDLRMINLRACTAAENGMNRVMSRKNTSGYKGVTWDKARKKWKAMIKINYTVYNLGRFDKKDDAALAYNEAAIKYSPEFAKLNIISSGTGS